MLWRLCRVGSRFSSPAAFELASFSPALRGIAYPIGVTLHARRDYYSHSRARHPAV
jgi:hypothetical protein